MVKYCFRLDGLDKSRKQFYLTSSRYNPSETVNAHTVRLCLRRYGYTGNSTRKFCFLKTRSRKQFATQKLKTRTSFDANSVTVTPQYNCRDLLTYFSQHTESRSEKHDSVTGVACEMHVDFSYHMD